MRDIFEGQKEKNYQPRNRYLEKLPSRLKEKIKAFPGKQKLRELVTTTPAVQEMLKGILQGDTEGC